MRNDKRLIEDYLPIVAIRELFERTLVRCRQELPKRGYSKELVQVIFTLLPHTGTGGRWHCPAASGFGVPASAGRQRNELTREAETALDRFFGDREWREIWQSGRVTPELQGKLLEHYKSKLRGLGYVDLKEHAGSYDPVIRNVKRAPLYRLVFASKHTLGAEFWAKVTSRDAYGQLRFLEPRATY